MSSTVDPTSTIQERTTQATHDLCAALGLENLSAANLKYLALALMQDAADEAARDADFAARIRSRYESLLPAPRATRTARGDESKSWNVKLIPIGNMDESLLDPYGPPNPFLLQQLYGDEQLTLALERYSPAKLKGALEIVQQGYPGTKPKKVSKAGIIEYIVSTIRRSPPDGGERA